MDLSPAEIRLLKIISQNIILSRHDQDGDVVDSATGKRVIPENTAERFVETGLARWWWDASYEEYRFVLTDRGEATLRAAGDDE